MIDEGRRRRAGALIGAVALAAVALSACTSSSGAGPSPAPTTSTATITSAIPTAPVGAGPTSSARKDCPLVAQASVQEIIGQRLDHTTVQSADGRVTGCTFYPITTGLAASEHLPKGGYPSARIVVTRYDSALSARQVLAIHARAGGSPSLQHVAGLTGETYRSTFYPPDGAKDWVCAVIKGPILMTVSVAEADGQGQSIVLGLTAAVAPKI